MICIYCLNKKTITANSRPHKTSSRVWRRRRCTTCQRMFTTYERPSLEDVMVRRSDATHSPFSLGTLTVSIYASLAPSHKKTAGTTSYELAQTVEQHLIMQYDISAAITTTAVADMTYRTLKRFDEISALQYGASYGIITSIRRRGRPSTTATSGDDVPELA